MIKYLIPTRQWDIVASHLAESCELIVSKFVRLKASSIEWVNQGREEWRHLADSVVTDGAT